MRRVCGAPGDSWFPKMAGGRKPCGGSYNDVERSTVCPHVSLGGGDTEGVQPHPDRVDPRWLQDEPEPKPKAGQESIFDEATRRWSDDAEFKARVTQVQQEAHILGWGEITRTSAAIILVADERARAGLQARRSEITDGMVRGALDLLSLAGWEVRKDDTIGQLIGDTGIVMAALNYDPENKHYVRWTAQEPWREVEPRADH